MEGSQFKCPRGPEKGGPHFSRKKGVKLFLLDSWGGQIFFVCVDAARSSSARNEECYLQAFNKYSDAI